jgi:hypothetical protein
VGEFLASDSSSFARRFWAGAHTSTSSGTADQPADGLLRPEAARALARLPDNSLFALYQHHPALADTDAPTSLSLVERIRMTAPPVAAESAVELPAALPAAVRAAAACACMQHADEDIILDCADFVAAWGVKQGLTRLVADALHVADRVCNVNLSVNVERSRQLRAAASVLTSMHNATVPAVASSSGGREARATPHYIMTLRVEGSRMTASDAGVQALLAAAKVAQHVVSLKLTTSNHSIAVLAYTCSR